MEKAPVKIDTLLEPLLHDVSDQEADELLSRLISEHADPVIQGVIRYKLHLNSSDSVQRAEADDIKQEVIVQLLGQLRRFHQLPDSHPISDVRGLAAIITHRACARWMRRQFPERHAFKNRLHYLLTHQRGFALWQDKDKKLVAGFLVWREQRKSIAISRFRELNDEALLSRIRLLKGSKQQELAEATAMIFNHVGGPIEFDELVSILSGLLGIRDQPIESLADEEDGSEFVPVATEPDPEWQIEKRMFLQRLWEEIQQLPVNQRSALLLNLKDPSRRWLHRVVSSNGCRIDSAISQFVGNGRQQIRSNMESPATRRRQDSGVIGGYETTGDQRS